MGNYSKLEEILSREIEKISEKGELTSNTLNSLNTLSNTLKNILKIEMLVDSSRYSNNDSYWEANGSYGTDTDRMRNYSRNSYYMDDSYNRGNNSYRNSYERGSYSKNNYSRNNGKHYIMNELKEMMDEAETEKEREALRQCMQSFEMV